MTEELKKKLTTELLADAIYIGVSILGVLVFIEYGILDTFLQKTASVAFLDAFIGGLFFTSIFTNAFAVTILGKIALTEPILPVAFIGALGATCGDFLLFEFIKDRFSTDLKPLFNTEDGKKLRHILQKKIFRWFSPIVAAAIIASPLPDEIGVAILGFVKTRTPAFVFYCFIANFFGVLGITAAVRLIF